MKGSNMYSWLQQMTLSLIWTSLSDFIKEYTEEICPKQHASEAPMINCFLGPGLRPFSNPHSVVYDLDLLSNCCVRAMTLLLYLNLNSVDSYFFYRKFFLFERSKWMLFLHSVSSSVTLKLIPSFEMDSVTNLCHWVSRFLSRT